MRRVGKKGEGRFERIPWQDALDEIERRFKDIIQAWGPQAILPYSFSGTLGLLSFGAMARRFFPKLGASHLGRTICSTTGAVGLTYRNGCGVLRWRPHHHPVGGQYAQLQPAPVALPPRGAKEGREAHRHRPAQVPHRPSSATSISLRCQAPTAPWRSG